MKLKDIVTLKTVIFLVTMTVSNVLWRNLTHTHIESTDLRQTSVNSKIESTLRIAMGFQHIYIK